MDVIRCDEQEYLVWKWRPSGAANSTTKENAIRYGSSLRVKDGELAVFVYKQNNGMLQDFITGPYDGTIKTANFPILTSMVGAAFGGASPFQAEVYFINLSGNVQIKFGIPYFDVFDPRFLDFAVPIAIRGTATFNITDYRNFIKLNRLIEFELSDFERQIRDMLAKYGKNIVSNIPSEKGIPVLQIERKLLEVSDTLYDALAKNFAEDFGVNLKRIDIAAIDVDKESEGYRELRSVTALQQRKTIAAQTDVGIKNMQDAQTINTANLEETLRIQREEVQRAQRLQTESNFMGAHTLDQQTEVLRTSAENLGAMGTMESNGGSMNPAGMMTGMMMGGALGGQMANLMNQMGGQMGQTLNTPPPIPLALYYIAINGQQSGPFPISQLQQLHQQGRINAETYVWRQGLPNWVKAGEIAELATLFNPGIPPIPQL